MITYAIEMRLASACVCMCVCACDDVVCVCMLAKGCDYLCHRDAFSVSMCVYACVCVCVCMLAKRCDYLCHRDAFGVSNRLGLIEQRHRRASRRQYLYFCTSESK